MQVTCIIFGFNNLPKEEVEGKSILDVGSYDWNGNFYGFVKNLKPAEFIGTDMQAGPGVDVVCRAEDIVEKFGAERFDVVLSSELIEHTRNWREVINNIKQVCKPGGTILVTTRSYGFGLHGYPHDYWRYEVEDMRKIFADCKILVLEKDTDRKAPGVFIKVKKPENFQAADLSNIALYSMIHGARVLNLDPEVERKFLQRTKTRERLLNIEKKIKQGVYHLAHRLLFRRSSK